MALHAGPGQVERLVRDVVAGMDEFLLMDTPLPFTGSSIPWSTDTFQPNDRLITFAETDCVATPTTSKTSHTEKTRGEEIVEIADKEPGDNMDLEKGGVKFDAGKIRMDLVPQDALMMIAAVFTYGAIKYDEWNWVKGMRVGRIMAALDRHKAAFLLGEELDDESGLPHLAHMGCCVMMLLSSMLRDRHEEDRHKALDGLAEVLELFRNMKNPVDTVKNGGVSVVEDTSLETEPRCIPLGADWPSGTFMGITGAQWDFLYRFKQGKDIPDSATSREVRSSLIAKKLLTESEVTSDGLAWTSIGARYVEEDCAAVLGDWERGRKDVVWDPVRDKFS